MHSWPIKIQGKVSKPKISGWEFDVRSRLLRPIKQDSGVDFVENGL